MTPLEVRRGLIRRRVGGKEALPSGPLIFVGQFHELARDEEQSVLDSLYDDPNEEATGTVECNTYRRPISCAFTIDGESMTVSVSAGSRW
jgi:hypothetical protein